MDAATVEQIAAKITAQGIHPTVARIAADAAIAAGLSVSNDRLREALQQARDRFESMGRHMKPDWTDEDREALATDWWFGLQEIEAALDITPIDAAGPDLRDEDIARRFHEAYERLAPSFGYETRRESAVSWEEVPANNRRLMVAVVGEVRAALVSDDRPTVDVDAQLEAVDKSLLLTFQWSDKDYQGKYGLAAHGFLRLLHERGWDVVPAADISPITGSENR